MEERTKNCSQPNELIRLRNIAESRQILAELGLHKSWQVQSNYNLNNEAGRIKCETENDDAQAFASLQDGTKSPNSKSPKRKKRLRHSPRIKTGTDETYYCRHQNLFGHIPGIAVGTLWATRIECCLSGVHRMPVAGIHGHPWYGCYSIALSGGYEDDLDLGDCFTYTGEGGRDTTRGTTNGNPNGMRTTPQCKDMIMTRGNLALTRSIRTRKPVRVIRGFQLQSPYAPLLGYRYDGLYFVEKYWECISHSGFRTIRFALRRCENQDPPPWISKIPAAPDSGYNSPESTSDCIPALELPLVDDEMDMNELDCRAADVDVDCDLEALSFKSAAKEAMSKTRADFSAATVIRRRGRPRGRPPKRPPKKATQKMDMNELGCKAADVDSDLDGSNSKSAKVALNKKGVDFSAATVVRRRGRPRERPPKRGRCKVKVLLGHNYSLRHSS